MRVLLLTSIPHYLASTIEAEGDSYTISMEEPKLWPEEIDFVVSFGYRYIIPEKVIEYYRGRMINLHISLLPWNRGADPNFWSWFNRTPKGVSIHAIDAGIDTGDVLAQIMGYPTPDHHTLRSSYATMVSLAAFLFAEQWPKLRKMDWDPIRVSGEGSYHRVADKEKWMKKLPLGWDTPVKDVEELGAAGQDN